MLLGAALNSKLALEQVAEAATRQGESNLLALRRLCSKLLATLRLGETRVKLFGRCAGCAPGGGARVSPPAAPAHARARASRRARYNVFVKALRVGRTKMVEDKFDEARAVGCQTPGATPRRARQPAARASLPRRCARRWRR